MRCSTAVAYLHPAAKPPNLKIVTDALTTRILFDGARAQRGRDRTFRGNSRKFMRTPRLSWQAEAYNSPQLLMLSGIGPAADLAFFFFFSLSPPPPLIATPPDRVDGAEYTDTGKAC